MSEYFPHLDFHTLFEEMNEQADEVSFGFSFEDIANNNTFVVNGLVNF
jgi:hypothetical protein